MRSFTDHRRIVAVGNDQPRFPGQIALLFEIARQMRRHRPVETIAIVEIVEPFAVADQVRLGDLDFDDREAAVTVDCHQIGAAAVGKRHFAHREQVLAAEQPRNAARDIRSNRRSIGEARRVGLGGHPLH